MILKCTKQYITRFFMHDSERDPVSLQYTLPSKYYKLLNWITSYTLTD